LVKQYRSEIEWALELADDLGLRRIDKRGGVGTLPSA
jgi:hypothetical protein